MHLWRFVLQEQNYEFQSLPHMALSECLGAKTPTCKQGLKINKLKHKKKRERKKKTTTKVWETEHEWLWNKLARMSAVMKNWAGTTTKLKKHRLPHISKHIKMRLNLIKLQPLLTHSHLHVLQQGRSATLHKWDCWGFTVCSSTITQQLHPNHSLHNPKSNSLSALKWERISLFVTMQHENTCAVKQCCGHMFKV